MVKFGRCGISGLGWLLMAGLVIGGCSSENKPNNSQLQEALSLELPAYLKVTDFSVDAMQNVGNEVEPNYVARFNAKAEVSTDLYVKDGSEDGLYFMKGATDAGSEIELFGKSSSVLFQGTWEHRMGIEGNPVAKLGRPIDAFTAGTVVRGSPEEAAYYDALKASDAEFEASVAGLPLQDLVSDFYDSRSEYAGQFAIHEILAIRTEKKTNAEFEVHAKYTYRKASGSKAEGEDRRKFIARIVEEKWQVVGMGGARSGRIE